MSLKQDLWENDPSLIPVTSTRKVQINEMTFDYFRQLGKRPAQAFPTDERLRAAYEDWLKTHPIES